MERFSEREPSKETVDLKRRLLPREIPPVGANSTFAESGFTCGTFDGLPLEKKLKVAADIVRQANRINYFPTPRSEAELSGDCFTTAKALREYLLSLGIKGDIKLAAVRRNPYDGDWRVSTRHVVVLHKDEMGAYRTVDSTAMVGYGYGTVSKAAKWVNGKLAPINNKNELIYKDVAFLTESDELVISQVNYLRYRFYIREECDVDQLLVAIGKVERKMGGDYMCAWLSELYYILAMAYKSQGDAENFGRAIKRTVFLNPLKPKLLKLEKLPELARKRVEDAMSNFQTTARRQSRVWEEEAQELLSKSSWVDLHRVVQLLQWIFREEKGAGFINEKTPSVKINGVDIAYYNINPRLISDFGLCTAWIKPSARIMGVQSAAREELLRVSKLIWEYGLNPTENLGGASLIPLLLTHPHAVREENFRAYAGPMVVMLLQEKRPGTVGKTKEKFRFDWGKIIKMQEDRDGVGRTIGYLHPGGEMTWNRFVTNYIHSADSGAEAVVHFLLGYPHLCLLNRWDYPHPDL